MGYYTYFTLRDNASMEKRREIALWMAENLDEWEWSRENRNLIEEIQTTTFCPYDYLFDDSMKWYEHNQDMKLVARQFPDVVFILQGIGEEFGDIWKKYYHGDDYHESAVRMVFDTPYWAEEVDL